MRVASRRTREALTLLEPYYPRKSFARLERPGARRHACLGRVRDADVLLEEFRSLAARARLRRGARDAGLARRLRAGPPRRARPPDAARLAALDLGADRRRRFERFAARRRATCPARASRWRRWRRRDRSPGDGALRSHAGRACRRTTRWRSTRCASTPSGCATAWRRSPRASDPSSRTLYPLLKGLAGRARRAPRPRRLHGPSARRRVRRSRRRGVTRTDRGGRR